MKKMIMGLIFILYGLMLNAFPWEIGFAIKDFSGKWKVSEIKIYEIKSDEYILIFDGSSDGYSGNGKVNFQMHTDFSDWTYYDGPVHVFIKDNTTYLMEIDELKFTLETGQKSENCSAPDVNIILQDGYEIGFEGEECRTGFSFTVGGNINFTTSNSYKQTIISQTSTLPEFAYYEGTPPSSILTTETFYRTSLYPKGLTFFNNTTKTKSFSPQDRQIGEKFSQGHYNFYTLQYFLNWENSSLNYLRTVQTNVNTTMAAFSDDKIPVTFNMNLEGSNITSQIKLIDPWYLNSSGVQQSAMEVVTGNSRVFLNLQPNPQDPSAPYYKFCIPSICSGLEVYYLSSQFVNASVGNQEGTGHFPIVFTGSIGGSASVTANLKAVLTSNTSNWVQNGMVNFNGKSTVLYKSMNELWLHFECGTTVKEIKVAPAPDAPARFNLLRTSNKIYVSYINSQGYLIVNQYSATTGDLISSVNLYNNSNGIPANATPIILSGGYYSTDSEGSPYFVPRVLVGYQSGTSFYHLNYFVDSNQWSSGWLSVNLSSYLTSSAGIKSATNGQFGYLYWTKDNILYSSQYGSGISTPVVVSNNSTSFASNIYHVAGSVDQNGSLNLVYTQRRYYNHDVYHRKVNTNNSMSSETLLESFYSTSYQTTPTIFHKCYLLKVQNYC